MRTFIPYGRQSIDDTDIDAVVQTLQSNFLTTGPAVQAFEEALADYCGARYCVAVANGTAALHLASMVLLQEGDRVLTTPNSFLATANSILYVGAHPIFIDIAEDGNIDLDQCITFLERDSSIRALYAVAFSGNPLNQTKLAEIKKRFGITILEDCAHAIGACFEGIRAGSCTFSECSVLSFHPVKHLTTGEGGAITTNSEVLYERLLKLRAHGMVKTPNMKPWEYEMRELGYNYRITDIQCALGLSQLTKLDLFIKQRHEIAQTYDTNFAGTVVRPLYPFNKNSSYHLYVVQVDFSNLSITKEKLFNSLKEKRIGIQLHYMPINKQPYYRGLGYGNEITPIMDRYYEECFSLPIYPALTEEEQIYVIENVLELLQ